MEYIGGGVEDQRNEQRQGRRMRFKEESNSRTGRLEGDKERRKREKKGINGR